MQFSHTSSPFPSSTAIITHLVGFRIWRPCRRTIVMSAVEGVAEKPEIKSSVNSGEKNSHCKAMLKGRGNGALRRGDYRRVADIGSNPNTIYIYFEVCRLWMEYDQQKNAGIVDPLQHNKCKANIGQGQHWPNGNGLPGTPMRGLPSRTAPHSSQVRPPRGSRSRRCAKTSRSSPYVHRRGS